MTALPRLAFLAATAFSLMAGTALAQDKTFNIWWFEGAESAQGITWTKALEELKANHPDVTVNFEPTNEASNPMSICSEVSQPRFGFGVFSGM